MAADLGINMLQTTSLAGARLDARAEAQRLLQQGLASVGAQDWDSAIATLEAALAIAHADDAAFQVWGELQTWLDHAKTEKEKGPAIPPAAAHATSSAKVRTIKSPCRMPAHDSTGAQAMTVNSTALRRYRWN